MTMEEKLQERQTLIDKAVRCEPVDKLPLIWQGTAPAPKLMGLTMAEFINNPLKVIESHLDYMDKLGVDGCNTPGWFRPDVDLTAAWLSHIRMPGREMPEDALWQVEEKEMMSTADYDFILENGFDAFMGQCLPKVVDMDVFQHGMAQLMEFGPIMLAKYKERGYPLVSGGMTTIPFESLCGGRSMMSFFMDLYRIPDKIEQVMEAITQVFIDRGLQCSQLSGVSGVWVGGWRTASALLAPKLWDRFVFPYMERVVNALAEKGVISILHLDQDWTRDLARFLELPANKCIMNLDGMTDIRKAREILGDHMAIMGDVPSDLLATGKPDGVRRYVKELINDIGTTGLLLCPGCDAPINARHENLIAMYDAGREFGDRS